ncbi:MAG: respiratory nitrate reductase subunit gamma [Acidobacteriota bacterium]
MTAVLFGIVYAGVLVFVIASIARACYYAKLPIHLRWELYPVPHEDPKRVKHGGSYFEEIDWWTKPRKTNLAGELAAMVPEMLFMVALWEHNRKLWIRSFPFHFGLYLLIGTTGLLLISALLTIFVPALMAGSFGLFMHWVYTVTGIAGVILSILGAAGLLARRLTDKMLKPYTTAGDIFNLVFFIATFVVLGAAYLIHRPDFGGTLALTVGLLRFDTAIQVPLLAKAGIVMGAVLAAYIPLTHMSHFVGKYFTYHAVRWSDEPNMRGSELEKRLAEYLTYRPTWAASHVTADGLRTWVDIATTNPAQGGRK